MTFELTQEQRQAVHTHPDEPIRMVDPQTNMQCVLIRADWAERPVEGDPREAYPLVDESFSAGWSDPAMADYDHYETRKQP
ncbi:hypothetical protein HYR82_05040 [Candidatus Peregrinibacteria bacterium]|nr:hypothetical protein [Candidatus Peregrinibacteria bacterium]